ncbi:MAG: hypothetical protein U0074_20005 [Kouleothrix sp.]
MLFEQRPTTLSSELIDALEANLTKELSPVIDQNFRSVHIVEEMYGRTSIYVRCETSIENYAAEALRINLAIAKVTAAYFQRHSLVECLVTRVDIWDDKVAVSNRWFHRNDILAWIHGDFDDLTLLERGTSYW